MKKLIALILVAVMLCFGLIGCGDKKADSILASAKENLEDLQADSITTTSTPGDFEVPATLMIDGVSLKVEWSVNVEAGVKVVVAEDGTVTIDVDENAEADIPYTLTAKITYGEGKKAKSVETSFEYVVPKFKELTWQEFFDTENDEPVVIKGTLTGIVETSKENDLYIQDENGGYFVYALDKKPSELGLKAGMTVRVRGIKGTYQGIHQVTEPTVEILDSTEKKVEALDITKAFTDAEDLTVDELFLKQSMLVTIKGTTVLGQSTADNTYYEFTLGGKISYVRISTSTSMLSKDDEAAFKSAVADHIGWEADITGLVSVYGGKVYIIPTDKNAFSNFKVINRTPEEQVEFAAGLITVTDKITENAEVELPTKDKVYEDVTITWTLTENACAALNGNVLKVTIPDAATELTLTATIKSGDATTTKTFKIKVSAMATDVAMPLGAMPETGKEHTYKLALKNTTFGATYYFDGALDKSNRYLNTTTDASKAVDVYAEPVDGETGKFYLAYLDGTLPYYINTFYSTDFNGGGVGCSLTQRPETKYVYDADIDAFTTEIEFTSDTSKSGAYYLGSYGTTYTTFSASLTSYANNKGSFVARFCNVLNVNETTDEKKIAIEKDLLTLPTEVKVDGKEIALAEYGEYFIKVGITWALGEGVTGATIEDGVLTVNLGDGERNIKVIATLKHGEKTDTKEFTIAVDAKPTVVPVKVPAPALNTGYKFALTQATLGQFLYFNGTVDSRGFLCSTEVFSEAPDVFVEEVSAGSQTYRLYFIDAANDNAKTYIEIFINSSNEKRLRLVTEPTTVYTWDADLGIYVCDVDATEEVDNYYIGTYSNFATFSPSGTFRLDDPAVIGVSQFVAYFYEMVDINAVTDEQKIAEEKEQLIFTVTDVTEAGNIALPTTPKSYDDVTITWAATDNALVTLNGNTLAVTLPALDGEDVTITLTATIACNGKSDTKTYEITLVAPTSAVTLNTAIPYNFYIYQAQLGKNLYFAGAPVSASVNYRLATTDDPTAATQTYLEAVDGVEGGYRMFFYDAANENTKTYINVYERSSSSGLSGSLSLETEVPANYYVWSNEYNTLVYKKDANTYYLGSYNDKDYIQGSSTSYITDTNLGVSQYVATISAAPVLGVAYDLSIKYPTDSKNYYFTGTISSYRLATGNDVAASVPVYAEAVTGVEGGFRLYFLDSANSDAKTYIEAYVSGTFQNMKLTTTATEGFYYVYSNELGALTCMLGETEYYIGAYNTKTTIGPSKASYIAGDNASSVGESNYVAVFTPHVFPPEVSDAEMVAAEKEALTLPSNVYVDTTLSLPTAGTTYGDVTIAWAAEGAAITDNKVTLIPGAAEQTVTLTATITSGTESDVKTLTVTVGVRKLAKEITAPAYETAYKIALWQANLGKVLYVNGEMSGHYIALTDDYSKAVDAYLEQYETGVRIYFLDGTTKKYFDIYNYGDGIGVTITDTPTAVFSVNTALNTIMANVDGSDYVFGATGTFETLAKQSPNTAGMMPAHLAAVIEASSFTDADKVAYEKSFVKFNTKVDANGDVAFVTTPTEFDDVTIAWTTDNATAAAVGDGKITFTLQDAATTVKVTATITAGEKFDLVEFTVNLPAKDNRVPTATTTPAEGTAYKLMATKDGVNYFFGVIPSYASTQIEVTAVMANGIDVYVKHVKNAENEVVGYNLYFMDGTTEKYITYGSSTNFAISDSAAENGFWSYDNSRWTWTTAATDAEGNVTYTVGTRYIGLNNTNTKLAAYATSGSYQAASLVTLEEPVA